MSTKLSKSAKGYNQASNIRILDCLVYLNKYYQGDMSEVKCSKASAWDLLLSCPTSCISFPNTTSYSPILIILRKLNLYQT